MIYALLVTLIILAYFFGVLRITLMQHTEISTTEETILVVGAAISAIIFIGISAILIYGLFA